MGWDCKTYCESEIVVELDETPGDDRAISTKQASRTHSHRLTGIQCVAPAVAHANKSVPNEIERVQGRGYSSFVQISSCDGS